MKITLQLDILLFAAPDVAPAGPGVYEGFREGL